MNRLEYNSRDCLATRMIFDALYPLLGEQERRVYEAEMGLQGAFLGVQMRGIKVDQKARLEVIQEIENEISILDRGLSLVINRPVMRGDKSKPGVHFNPQSSDQVREYLYDHLGMAVQYDRKTKKPSAGEEILARFVKRSIALRVEVPREEKTRRKDLAAQVADLILKSRDLAKQASSLSTTLQENGRIRTTLVSGGTESYRASSHKAHTGKGINHQNVDKRLRRVYIPDDSFIMGQMDQTRAESMTVAYCSGDEKYIQAHLDENTHVYVARLLFPTQPWTGEAASDKELANSVTLDGKPKHGRNDLYNTAKMIQHGLNYLLTPDGLARHAHMTVKQAETVYDAYFSAFKGISIWHQTVIAELRETGLVQCPGGFRRIFFGRRNDRATWREAISFIPQAVVAWTNHIVFTRLYYGLDSGAFQVLSHGHDAILFQIRNDMFETMPLDIANVSRVEWPILGRTMVIPWEIKFGKNWQEVS